MPTFSEGDWVQWEWSEGTAYGKVTEVATSGTLSVEGGSRDASEEEPAYKLRHWENGEWGNPVVKSESELSAWSDPPSNAPTIDGVSSELSKDGVEMADATTVQDTITYSGVETGELDESEIPNDDYEAHYVFDADTKSESSYPLVDADGNLCRGNVQSAWEVYGQAEDEQLLLDVLAEVNDAFDDPPIPEESLAEARKSTDSTHMQDTADAFADFVPAQITNPETGHRLCDRDVDWSSVPVEQLDDAPHADAFGTDQFYALDTVVAKPMDQQYTIGEETYTFRKTAAELRDAAWQLDNAPYTLSHPPAREVTDADQIHGFFRDPSYVDDLSRQFEGVDGGGLTATLYVPVTDTRAQSMIEDTTALSIGFTPDIDTDVEDESIDGVQRDLVIDHVASVEQGRCSVEEGCGVQAFADEQDDATVAVADCTTCSTGDCSCGWHDHHSEADTMSDDSDTDLSDLSVDEIVDRHDGVAETLADKDEEIEEKEERIESLEDDIESLTDERDEIAEALEDRLEDDFADAKETLTSVTDKYTEDGLDETWADADGVAAKREILADLRDDVELLTDVADNIEEDDTSISTLVDSDDGGTGGSTTDHDHSPRASDNGRVDLREKTAD